MCVVILSMRVIRRAATSYIQNIASYSFLLILLSVLLLQSMLCTGSGYNGDVAEIRNTSMVIRPWRLKTKKRRNDQEEDQKPKITWVGVQLTFITLMYIAGYIIVFLIIFILGKNWLCDLIMQYYSK